MLRSRVAQGPVRFGVREAGNELVDGSVQRRRNLGLLGGERLRGGLEAAAIGDEHRDPRSSPRAVSRRAWSRSPSSALTMKAMTSAFSSTTMAPSASLISMLSAIRVRLCSGLAFDEDDGEHPERDADRTGIAGLAG